MFTLEEIQNLHAKVKTGADFPLYLNDLKKIGLIYYEVKVENGVTKFYGDDKHSVESSKKYDTLKISKQVNLNQFKIDLLNHQQGHTDYITFCKDAAKSGIFKWEVDTNKSTCTYLDRDNNILIVEEIPER